MIDGFNDVYSVDIGRATGDPVVWRHPFTSSAMPFRGEYEVTTEGPEGVMDVPSDAFKWDADSDTWVTVGTGVNATSKVVFDYSKYTLGQKWHHDIEISMADILYYKAMGWDIAEDAEKSVRESARSSGAQGLYNTIKGIVVVDDHTVEVYTDYYHFDDNEIAIFIGAGWHGGIGYNPWELLAAQEDVVFEKQLAAFGQQSADLYGLPWLSLVLSEHAGLVTDSLEELLAEEYYPSNYWTLGETDWGDGLDNAKERYQACIDWYNEKDILWINCGPFILNDFDAEAQYAETIAYRDPTYPFEPGDWYYGRPKVPEVVEVTLPTITKGLAADIDLTMAGPENLAATYIITDEATGALVLKGEAETTATYGELSVPLSSEDTDLLDIGGRYVLTILGRSPDVAFLSTATERFVVRDPLIVGLGETVDELTGTIDTMSGRLEGVSSDLATAIDALGDLVATTTDDLRSDLSSDIGSVTQAVSETSDSVDKLVGSTNTLLYAIVATLIVALIGVAIPYMKKS
jgi:peptide/nickel transport system substrate-binding protein